MLNYQVKIAHIIKDPARELQQLRELEAQSRSLAQDMHQNRSPVPVNHNFSGSAIPPLVMMYVASRSGQSTSTH